jgi:ATP-dependent helicase/nuclease subunit A
MTADARSRAIAADADARLRAQSVFDEPVVVEAGAGTGKTNILVARVVVWSLSAGWERAAARLADDPTHAAGGSVPPDKIAAETLGRVAAITFTEAAAAEMALRTGETLARIADGEVPTGVEEDLLPADLEVRSARSRMLIGALDHLVVRTIHAFCRGLLAQYPLEAKLHPGFQVDADELVQAEVVREVVESAAVRAYAQPPDPDWVALAVDGFGPDRIEAAVTQLVAAGASPDAFADDPFSSARIDAYVAELDGALAAFEREDGGRLAGATSVKTAVATVEAIARARARIGEGVEASLAGLSRFFDDAGANWSDAASKRVADWAKGKFAKGETKALDGETEAVSQRAADLVGPLARLRDLDPERLQRALHVIQPLLVEVFEQMRRRGAASYDSLLRGARDLLVENPGVARRFRGDLDQLLVDEFQDTDPLQCDLVRCIAREGEADDRPGLFLVGDPKQSIYGWRRADLGAYDDFTREILGEREPDRLSRNFRSLPEVLDEVERVIEPVMERETGMQPEFQRLFANRPQPAEGSRAVEHWVTWRWNVETGECEFPSAPQAAQQEAAAIAHDLTERREGGGLAWSDVGILFRSTGDLDVYLQALRTANIPYAVERDRNYYRRREIIDASALVRCVVDPNDQLALLATLRSAIVGLPDAALLPLWRRGFPRLVAELHDPESARWSEVEGVIADSLADLPEGVPAAALPDGWDVSLRGALKVLAVLRASFVEDVADVFVEKLRRLTLLESTEAARYLGAYRVANLDRFFRDLVAELETLGDPAALLRRLRREVAEQAEAEEARPGGFVDAVRVMTIHKAKGLQFKHTYLVQLHKQSGGRGRADEKAELDHFEGRSEYRIFGAQSLGFHAIAARRGRVEAAERVRSLYVAMTRAEDRLVLLGNWDEVPEPTPVASAKSHLALIASRAPEGPDLLGTLAAAVAGGDEDCCEHTGARWRFPSLWQAPAAERAGATTGASTSNLRALPDDAGALRARRALAAQRAARPWNSAPSADSHVDVREEQAARRFRDSANAAEAGVQSQSQSEMALGVGARSAAKAAGTVVHRILEEFDLSADVALELARQRERLPELVVALAGPGDRDEAIAIADEVLDALERGGLLATLAALGDHVIARELPVLLPPAGTSGGALAFAAGSIDLCYRDPETDEWVVVDYKTDRVETDADVAERVQRYAEQGRAYQRALRDALGLDAAPRFELWFLRADRIESVA